jgi:hypothetical protein
VVDTRGSLLAARSEPSSTLNHLRGG